jgi:hypothetical protein
MRNSSGLDETGIRNARSAVPMQERLSRQRLFRDQSLSPTLSAGVDRKLTVLPDAPDLRDRVYEPALIRLEIEKPPPHHLIEVLDQGQEGACTGFGLAAIINLLNRTRYGHGYPGSQPTPNVSPRMLYEMAKLNDDFPDDSEGSTLRAALKGFFHNGVCPDSLAPYLPGNNNWVLDREAAIAARANGLGAYFRLRPEIIDYHVALNEVGAIYCGARTHSGWNQPEAQPSGGGTWSAIRKSSKLSGGHAFAIIGYNADGFWIQNSWGHDWGHGGIAHWSYEDWADNVMDAWVLQLAVPTPDSFHLTIRPFATAPTINSAAGPGTTRRTDIIGHFANIDDGRLQEKGSYATPRVSLVKTAEYLVEDAKSDRKYPRIVIYVHGGLNTRDDEAKRVAGMKDTFKENGIYPFHLMWGTGAIDELTDSLARCARKLEERVGGFTDLTDWALEKSTSWLGRAIWNEIKNDASTAFSSGGGGITALPAVIDPALRLSKDLRPEIHIVAHSAGAVLVGHLLKANASKWVPFIKSVNLMAPACTHEFFKTHYAEHLGRAASPKLVIYRLSDLQEQADDVGPYGKSLLYLVSNAYEEKSKIPLLGMDAFNMALPKNTEVRISGAPKARSDSTSHGGFDNDANTMNDILRTILGAKPKVPFRQEHMQDY